MTKTKRSYPLLLTLHLIYSIACNCLILEGTPFCERKGYLKGLVSLSCGLWQLAKLFNAVNFSQILAHFKYYLILNTSSLSNLENKRGKLTNVFKTRHVVKLDVYLYMWSWGGGEAPALLYFSMAPSPCSGNIFTIKPLHVKLGRRGGSSILLYIHY